MSIHVPAKIRAVEARTAGISGISNAIFNLVDLDEEEEAYFGASL